MERLIKEGGRAAVLEENKYTACIAGVFESAHVIQYPRNAERCKDNFLVLTHPGKAALILEAYNQRSVWQNLVYTLVDGSLDSKSFNERLQLFTGLKEAIFGHAQGHVDANKTFIVKNSITSI